MRFSLTILVIVLAATVASAQSISTRYDMSALGWGVLTQPWALDTDGNPMTQEWLVGRIFTNDRRVVAVRADGGMCAGPWFAVTPDWTLQTVGGRSKLVRMVWPHLEIMDLAHPTC